MTGRHCIMATATPSFSSRNSRTRCSRSFCEDRRQSCLRLAFQAPLLIKASVCSRIIPSQHANHRPVGAIAVKTQHPRDQSPRMGAALIGALRATIVLGGRTVWPAPRSISLLDSRTSDRARRFSRADCFTSDLITKMFVIGALLRRPTGAKSNGA
jgi:hypothetical protein